MAKIKTLKDSKDEPIYPITISEAFLDAKGDPIIPQIEEKIKDIKGADGKSAYQFAQEAGYTGTETEFGAKLNQTTFANPFPLTFTGGVTAEYDGSGAVTVTIPEGSGGSGGTVRIEKLSTDTAVELEPNKLYIFPEMEELTLTFAEPSDTGIVNEYHLVFQSGATGTTLIIPDTVKIPSGFTVDASKIYEISILEGCLCAQSWAVTA